MIITRTDNKQLHYDGQVMIYDGQVVLFNFPTYAIEAFNFSFTEQDMGDSSITMDIKTPTGIIPEFSLDWQVQYRGEIYYLKTLNPQGKKDTSSLQYQYSLTFMPDEGLKHRRFGDILVLDDGSLQPISFDFAFFGTLTEFVDRFNQNLAYYFPAQWRMQLNPDIEINPQGVTVAANNATLWEMVTQVYDLYGVRWSRSRAEGQQVIMVGYPTTEIEHIFEYSEGLLSVERVNPLVDIFTRLIGRGATRNKPNRYFKTESGAFRGDPDANPILATMHFTNIMPEAYRDYVRGWNTGEAGTLPAPNETRFYYMGFSDQQAGRRMQPVTYAESENIEKWGIREGTIADNEGLYPSIQNIWLPPISGTPRGRADELVYVEPITNDDWEDVADGVVADVPSISNSHIFYSQSQRNSTRIQRTQSVFATHQRNSLSFTLAMRSQVLNPEYLTAVIDVRLIDAKGSVINSRSYTQDDFSLSALTGAFSGLTPGSYSLELHSSLHYAGLVLVGAASLATIELSGVLMRLSDGVGEFKETFDIWIKDVWGETGDLVEVWLPKIAENEMTVMFSDGLLAGDYEFVVAKDPIIGNPDVVDPATGDHWCIWFDDSKSITTKDEDGQEIIVRSKYRLSLIKSDSEREASGLYLPNIMRNAKAGDHFFFINIEMPHQYVLWAEANVQEWLGVELAKIDDENPTFSIRPSSIFCASFTEANKLRAGAKLRLRDEQLIGDSHIDLHIQSLTIQERDKMLPQWTMTVSETIVGNTSRVDVIEGDVRRLSSNMYSSRQTTAQMARQMDGMFLRKDGVWDTSSSPTTFERDLTIGATLRDKVFRQGDFAGAGFGVYTDFQGASVVEADKIVARREMRVNEVIVNQVTLMGGKQIFSAAGCKVERVEEVPGNAIPIGVDNSLRSGVGWSISGAVDFVQLDGISCMRAQGVGGVHLDAQTSVWPANLQQVLAVDVFAMEATRIEIGAEGYGEIEIGEAQTKRWIRFSLSATPEDNVGIVVRNIEDSIVYFKNAKLEPGSSATEYIESNSDAYRCYIDTKDGSLINNFAIEDQGYCQRFDSTSSEIIKYYWRAVTGVGFDYIDLSVINKDGDGLPEVGDNVAQLGNKTNRMRQSAIVIDVVREGGALASWLDDIKDFNLIEKDNINIGRVDGQTWAQVFGNFYVGTREQDKYLKYEDGKLIFKGDVFQSTADMSRIEGDFIVTGYIGVGSSEEAVLGGLTSQNAPLPSPLPPEWQSGSHKVRFWAGAAFEDRLNAPFRVQENGKVIAKNLEASGTFTATNPDIGTRAEIGVSGVRILDQYGNVIAGLDHTRVYLRDKFVGGNYSEMRLTAGGIGFSHNGKAIWGTSHAGFDFPGLSIANPGGDGSAPIVRLTNIPLYNVAHYEQVWLSGTVYRDANNFLKIKP